MNVILKWIGRTQTHARAFKILHETTGGKIFSTLTTQHAITAQQPGLQIRSSVSQAPTAHNHLMIWWWSKEKNMNERMYSCCVLTFFIVNNLPLFDGFGFICTLLAPYLNKLEIRQRRTDRLTQWLTGWHTFAWMKIWFSPFAHLAAYYWRYRVSFLLKCRRYDVHGTYHQSICVVVDVVGAATMAMTLGLDTILELLDFLLRHA